MFHVGLLLWYGMDGNNVLINDPNSTKASRLKAPISTFQNQVKYYFEVIVDYGKKEDDDMTKEQIFDMIDEWFINRGLIPIQDNMKPDLDWAYNRGIMKDGAYNRPATRAEVAIVAHRLYDIITDEDDKK